MMGELIYLLVDVNHNGKPVLSSGSPKEGLDSGWTLTVSRSTVGIWTKMLTDACDIVDSRRSEMTVCVTEINVSGSSDLAEER